MNENTMRWAMRSGAYCALGLALVFGGGAAAQEGWGDADRVQSSVTLSSGTTGQSRLWVERSDGAQLEVTFTGGAIAVDGSRIGAYELDGELAAYWRDFLRGLAGASGRSVREALLELLDQLEDLSRDATGSEAEAARTLSGRVTEFLGLARPAAVVPEPPSTIAGPDGSPLAIAPGGVEFDELLGQLDRLRRALGRLGETGSAAADHLALIVHDDYSIAADRAIGGNLALLDGTLRLAGRVSGDVLMLDGDLVLLDGARIDGDVLQAGGELSIDGELAVISGEILSDFAVATDVAETSDVVAPGAAETPVVVTTRTSRGQSRGPFSRFARNFGYAGEGIVRALSTLVTLGVLGLLFVFFAQSRLEMVADTVRHEFARSFAMGLAGEVLFFPALLVLAVLVITLPILPFFVLAAAIAMLAGYLAVAHGAGEMFARRRYRYEWLERLRRSNSYYYVLSGLVLLLLPFAATAALWVFGGTMDLFRGILYFVACLGTWVLVTAGFGGVLLTRAGSRSVVVDWSSGTHAEPMVDAEAFVDVDVTPPHAPNDGDGSASPGGEESPGV
jgi:hypothetical protein